MKIRWKEHEMIFVSIVATIFIGSYLWNVYHFSADKFNSDYAAPFVNNHVPFDFYRNMLVPQIGAGLLIYLSYLFINLYTIPHLLFPNKSEKVDLKISSFYKNASLDGIAHKTLKKYLWLIFQIGLIVFLLGTTLNTAIYYLYQWQFNYPGFSIFFNKDNSNSQIYLLQGYSIASSLTGIYAVYVCIREVIINFIEKSGNRRAYRILICNQISAFLSIYLLIPFFVITFHFSHEYALNVAYFSLVIPVFLVFMSNTYWLFPLKREKSFVNSWIIIRLLLSTLIYTLPFVLFSIHEGFIRVFVVCWAIQLFIVTPISWLLYQQRKDKILQLRGAEKALEKSKTDLQFLRSQINPHFLFNVLNTLYAEALLENAERTASGIQKLGDMMRFMLRENNLESIPLSREIEYLENYISLQKLRTQSSPEIIIEYNLNDNDFNHKIAPMLLIPLVENAFKHGISLKEKSWIKIILKCNGEKILFEIRNSMHPQQNNDPVKEVSGIGLQNVIERLKLIYPGRHNISVNNDSKEFFVKISIQP